MILSQAKGRSAVIALALAAGVVAGREARANENEPFVGVRELSQEELVREVLRRNPSVDAARAAWQAALAQAPQESALDDPMLSYGIAPISVFDPESRLGQSVQIEQRFPFPGKLRLRREMALAEAEVARESWNETRLRLALAAALLYSDWYVAHRAIETNAEHIALLESLKKSAEAQYVVGRASQQDPLQAEVELSHVLHETIVLETQRHTVRAEINALLHRPPQASLPAPPAKLSVTDAAPPASEELQELALRQRPELAGARAAQGGGRSAIELARRAYYPDFGVMASYNSMWMDLPHQIMVGVSVNVPIQLGKRRAAVDQARANFSRLTSERERLQDAIRAEVDQARQRLVEAIHVVHLYRTRLVPAATDQVAAARAGFETARNSFLAVIEAEKNQRAVDLRAEIALADVRRREAELERSIGNVPGESEKGNLP